MIDPVSLYGVIGVSAQFVGLAKYVPAIIHSLKYADRDARWIRSQYKILQLSMDDLKDTIVEAGKAGVSIFEKASQKDLKEELQKEYIYLKKDFKRIATKLKSPPGKSVIWQNVSKVWFWVLSKEQVKDSLSRLLVLYTELSVVLQNACIRLMCEMWKKDPTLSPAKVKKRVKRTAKQMSISRNNLRSAKKERKAVFKGRQNAGPTNSFSEERLQQLFAEFRTAQESSNRQILRELREWANQREVEEQNSHPDRAPLATPNPQIDPIPPPSHTQTGGSHISTMPSVVEEQTGASVDNRASNPSSSVAGISESSRQRRKSTRRRSDQRLPDTQIEEVSKMGPTPGTDGRQPPEVPRRPPPRNRASVVGPVYHDTGTDIIETHREWRAVPSDDGNSVVSGGSRRSKTSRSSRRSKGEE